MASEVTSDLKFELSGLNNPCSSASPAPIMLYLTNLPEESQISSLDLQASPQVKITDPREQPSQWPNDTPLLPILREPDLERERGRRNGHTHSLMLTPIPPSRQVPSKWVEAVCRQASEVVRTP